MWNCCLTKHEADSTDGHHQAVLFPCLWQYEVYVRLSCESKQVQV